MGGCWKIGMNFVHLLIWLQSKSNKLCLMDLIKLSFPNNDVV